MQNLAFLLSQKARLEPNTKSAVFCNWDPHSSCREAPKPACTRPLTGVGLQQHLCLPQDFLCPVLGAVRPGQQVFKVGIKLGLLGLAEFLLCELLG